jgi:hypothetical protein
MGILSFALDYLTNFRIERVDCGDVHEFLEHLSPHGPHFDREEPPVPWVFRGHSDADHPLTPSALRHERILQYFLQDALPHDTEGLQIEAEIRAAVAFFLRANRDGLSIPGDSTPLRRWIDQYKAHDLRQSIEGGRIAWPPDEVLPLLAICQHFGLPTRLLDWSNSAAVAAYFAAADVALAEPAADTGDARIAVWALSLQLVNLRQLVDVSRNENPLLFVTVPTATNANLHAQKGLFTLFRPARVDPATTVDRSPLDAKLLNTAKDAGKPVAGPPTMYKFTLPKRLAGELLFALAKEQVDASSLFPGYGGVVRGLLEERAWKRPVRSR